MDKIKTIKGTHDILPEFSHNWQNLEKTIHDSAKLFGYKEIRTPIIEQAKLFNRGIGEGTDIVSKEMYSWLDRDEKAIALRPEMTASVVRSFIQHKLTDVSRERLKHNPLRILDTKNEEEINILKAAPIIGDFYTNEDREHFENLQKYLNAVSIPFTLDPLLVRGLDYYTQTTFEIISNDIGAQDALLGGGRYNGLIRSLGGKDTPAVGFAAGMERILLATNNNENSGRKIQTIYIVCVEEDVLNSVQKIARELRALNFMVLTETLRRSMKAQMREANKCNADLAIIIGEQEKNDKTVQVKNLNDGSQQTIEQR